ncbi:peptidoglycan editing factor PgeF [Paenibacillus sp. 598K]|uniref:peptidoglycan editing factor PgeF n=1 Tax=Paenibacillus sp. 598K TaxID=1117987 RepID=UPI000FFE3CD0|nr:peptidoglycan editing factor PgeF [Paenibacillus sp. 598K]
MEPFAAMDAEKRPSLYVLSAWVERYPGLTAGFTGRHGGVSGTPWESLNVGLHVGDDPAAVVRNRELVAEAIGWSAEAWTSSEQVHGAVVRHVGACERGRGRLSREDALTDCDAVVTAEKGVLLTSLYADCVPLYFYDPRHEVVALAHAGWKGTVLRIAEATLGEMEERYGCNPAEVRAAIGPAIGSCCYEVDEPVLTRAVPLIEELAAENDADLSGMLEETEPGKGRLNLKEINRQIMIKAGILPMHIELSTRCTGCRTDLFFSHRMEGGRTGRMASWIGMEKR